MLVDYLTGILCAINEHRLSSEIGWLSWSNSQSPDFSISWNCQCPRYLFIEEWIRNQNGYHLLLHFQ
ncbi:phage holin family protein [Limosilactobacillus reuteri]